MMVTIEDRAVKFIPMELETTLKLEPCCITCKATNKPLKSCSSCKLVFYCSKECQAGDWERHKTEDECKTVKKARRRIDQIKGAICESCVNLSDIAHDSFGEDAFLGRDIPDDGPLEDSIFDLLAGRFRDLPFTQQYIDSVLDLYVKVIGDSERQPSRCELWEQALEMAVEIKRLSHVSTPHLMDTEIPKILLKLHRNDDAVTFINYWRLSAAGGADCSHLVNSIKGEWPFRIMEHSQYDGAIKIPGFESRQSRVIPVNFVLVFLAIKLRHVYIYRTIKERADAFRLSVAGQELPVDIGNKIVSFLFGTELSAYPHYAVFMYQWEVCHKLMNMIDESHPHILSGVLDSSLLPPDEVTNDDDQRFDVKGFLETYEGSPPVLKMFTDILKLRYAYSDFEYWENFKRKLPYYQAE